MDHVFSRQDLFGTPLYLGMRYEKLQLLETGKQELA